MSEEEILELVRHDGWMMKVLSAARDLDLPDWMIGAGFIRNKVWDALHGFSRTPPSDIDFLYFDRTDPACAGSYIETTESEKELEKRLPDVGVPWSVVNQARMHMLKNSPPYTSSEDAISYWVETPTCIAIKLHADDSLSLIAPIGIEDLVGLAVRPNQRYLDAIGPTGLERYRRRVTKKGWDKKWPKLKLYNMND